MSESATSRREYHRLWKQRWRQKNRVRNREIDERYRAAHSDQKIANSRRWRAELRAKVFGHYGTVCACCGTDKQLTIDHIYGAGEEHRCSLFGTNGSGYSYQLYLWLADNDFPAGFQTLCMPCNCSKRDGERCNIDHSEDPTERRLRINREKTARWRARRAPPRPD